MILAAETFPFVIPTTLNLLSPIILRSTRTKFSMVPVLVDSRDFKEN
jgi:hypothetical protein